MSWTGLEPVHSSPMDEHGEGQMNRRFDFDAYFGFGGNLCFFGLSATSG